MKRIYICFPEGRYKALTLSYDDGKITDRRLTEIFRAADIRATFHLNSAYLGSSAGHRIPYISEDEVKTLYKGFEVASHTCTHPTMGRTPAALNISEVLKDREALEHLCGYPVQGFSYPNGVYSEELSALLKKLGHLLLTDVIGIRLAQPLEYGNGFHNGTVSNKKFIPADLIARSEFVQQRSRGGRVFQGHLAYLLL